MPSSFHAAGVPYLTLLKLYDELLTARTPPWQTPRGLAALAVNATCMLEDWFKASSASLLSGGAGGAGGAFPATEVESRIGKWLMALGQGGGGGGAAAEGTREVVARLEAVQRQVRRQF